MLSTVSARLVAGALATHTRKSDQGGGEEGNMANNLINQSSGMPSRANTKKHEIIVLACGRCSPMRYARLLVFFPR